jgi:hypothetical protein
VDHLLCPVAACLLSAGRSFHIHARDLHLVLETTKDGKPVRFRVKLDGTPPGDEHGGDIDTNGTGTVPGHRLYQFIPPKGTVEDKLNSSI